MDQIDRKAHWENVYSTKGEKEVSWFQDNPAPSLDLLALVGATTDTQIVDIGGGASRLIDVLLEKGFGHVTVLDLSEAALLTAKARVGAKAANAKWVASDVTKWEPQQTFDVWHDRAAFHFLTEAAAQSDYVDKLHHALVHGGHAIIGTFTLDGPEKCSALPVTRHDANSLSRLLGNQFDLIDARRDDHVTPWGAIQQFQFSTFRRR